MPEKKKQPPKAKSKTLLSQTKLTTSTVVKEKVKSTDPAAVESKPAKKPAPKAKSPQKPKVGKKRPIKVLSSDEDEDNKPPIKKSPAKAGKKRGKAVLTSSEDEEDIDEVEVLPLKKRVARATAKKVFDLH